ncbi:MAG: hypothetical protein RMK91_00295 [Pseudanabaenaceae cyanobacterium SKYGB_i_bin29]|nr:hypothetical protein [Pseudanabaenaceae cyanobacterium SKYG29]MDW8420292.1 hypothetical protein [Pseudanabaenaceae cyanobacterium SKYGB_i_bin29]
MIITVLLLNLALSGVLVWLTWHCWRWYRGTKRATRALDRWHQYLAVRFPLFTLKQHRNRLYLLQWQQTYRRAQLFYQWGTFLLSWKKRWQKTHDKRHR